MPFQVRQAYCRGKHTGKVAQELTQQLALRGGMATKGIMQMAPPAAGVVLPGSPVTGSDKSVQGYSVLPSAPRASVLVLQDVSVVIKLRDGQSRLIVLDELPLSANPTTSEFRMALQRTCLCDPGNDAFLQKWARISYAAICANKKPGEWIRIDSDSVLGDLVQRVARNPASIIFSVEQCRNPRFSAAAPSSSDRHTRTDAVRGRTPPHSGARLLPVGYYQEYDQVAFDPMASTTHRLSHTEPDMRWSAFGDARLGLMLHPSSGCSGYSHGPFGLMAHGNFPAPAPGPTGAHGQMMFYDPYCGYFFGAM
ncbi:hypothetical protein FVE85_6754 [Porphyridium purpureum]|uniref:Uncharacterized protein n=1 Tax=Porphyridium purpureum TaxID=35688 RepID=A0A5J4Z570_PORPP|nr:hypothetical protein FVE85_6754 [Porphyridium purpureum]|eukprot:POR4137..scf295_1